MDKPMLIHASASNPPTLGITWEERMQGSDRGLISAWMAGREMRTSRPEIAQAATLGELPVLPFKGGVEKKIKAGKKIGALEYIAMWQGLRGEDLHVTLGSRPIMRCAKTGMQVYYTDDINALFKSAAT